MPRVMTLGRLPLSGEYRPAPGRHLGYLSGLGSFCSDPAAALIVATGAGAGAGMTQYGQTATYGSGDQQTTGDTGWGAAGSGVTAFSNSLAQMCAAQNQRDLERARLEASVGDPVAVAQIQAQAQIEAIRIQQQTALAQQQMALASQQPAQQRILGMEPKHLALVGGATLGAGLLAVLLLRR